MDQLFKRPQQVQELKVHMDTQYKASDPQDRNSILSFLSDFKQRTEYIPVHEKYCFETVFSLVWEILSVSTGFIKPLPT